MTPEAAAGGGETGEAFSVLRALPETRQAGLVEQMHQQGLDSVCDQLGTEGLSTTANALVEFYLWRRMRDRFTAWGRECEAAMDFLRTLRAASAGEIERLGQRFFELRAVVREDVEAFALLVATRSRARRARRLSAVERAKLGLEQRRFERDTTQLCLAKLPELQAIAAHPTLEPRARLEAARRVLFGTAAAEALPPSPAAAAP